MLDSPAVLNFRLLNLALLGPAYTVPEVLQELRDFHARLVLEAASTQLRVQEPESRYIERVRRFTKDRGFLRKLSTTDLKLLALAAQLRHHNPGSRVVLLTDDYTLQNVAALLGLQFRPLIRSGISRVKRRLIYVCPVCGVRCPGTRCPRCGSKCQPKLL